MNFKKLIALGIVAATLTAPVSALAATNQSTKTAIQSVEERDKLENYVKFNIELKQYEIVSSAKNDLSSEEFATLSNTISETNKTVAQAYADKNLIVTVNGNTVKVTPKVRPTKPTKPTNPGTVTPNHINTYTSYWDYEIEYWGMRIFLSHNFVDNMKNKVGNATTYFAGGGTALAATELFKELGIASGPAGVLGFAMGGAAVYAYDRICSQCNDCGVFIDVNTLGGYYFSGIYGAWEMST